MISILPAEPQDARAILGLQKLAYQSEARLYNDWSLPPLAQTLESLLDLYQRLGYEIFRTEHLSSTLSITFLQKSAGAVAGQEEQNQETR